MTTPLTSDQLNEYAVLAETADHIGESVSPRVVTELVNEIRRIQSQRRYLIGQLAKRSAASGDADRKLAEFLTSGTETEQAPTPLTDSRNPNDNREPFLWNDAIGNLLAIHPDCADDEDRPTVALRVADLVSECCFHAPQAETPRLAADLCAAAGFRELSELLLAALAEQPAP